MEKTYTVLSRLRHDGKRYGINDKVTMTTEQAKQLIDIFVIEESTTELLPDDDEIIPTIVESFKKRSESGEPLEKKPKVDDVREWLDDDSITVEQRDEAWDIYYHNEDGGF